MSDTFKPGDLVELKSGGPVMTVEQVDMSSIDALTVWCVWFEKVKKHEGTFRPETLKLASQDDPPSQRPKVNVGHASSKKWAK